MTIIGQLRKNMKKLQAIVITKHHPYLNFGQIVVLDKVLLDRAGVINAFPQGEEKKSVQIEAKGLWRCDLAHEYEKLNKAIENNERK